MALSKKEIESLREELLACGKPLFFFHDDADGLCSFLLLYKNKREGKGVVLKSAPKLDTKFVRKVEEYGPDKVFVTDIAIVEQAFLDRVKVPVIWIDHHEPLQRDRVKYFNPRKAKPDDNLPATYLCYQVVEENSWIAAVGCIGDWVYLPPVDDFKKNYPDLLPIDSKDPGDILFSTGLGRLAKMFNFVLKGSTTEVNKCVRIMTRIEDPREMLDATTEQGKYLHKRFSKINSDYEKMLSDALKKGIKDKMVLYTYKEDKMSFTGELSNELLYRYPDKVIIIAREKSGDMRMSLRSKGRHIRPILQKALIGVEGYGGGHEHACGASVKAGDFERFVRNVEGLI